MKSTGFPAFHGPWVALMLKGDIVLAITAPQRALCLLVLLCTQGAASFHQSALQSTTHRATPNEHPVTWAPWQG